MSFKVIDYLDRKKADMYALCDNWDNNLVNEAKINAPWKDITPHARQAIHGGVEVVNSDYTIYLSHGVEYGTYLEEGTGLYGPKKSLIEIRPKNKKALYWKGASHPVKKVMSKGMKPRPIIEPTLKANKERIRNTVIDYWSD